MGFSNPFGGSTAYVLFCCFVFAWGEVLFGIDTGSFGSIQALPSWLRKFGVKNASGSYVLTTARQSIMNSVVWPGKLLGVFIFEPFAERWGYKKSMYLVAVIQFVALIIEMTAKNWVQFTVGRVLAYIGVGIVENAAPTYMAEIAPANMRGMLGSTVQLVASAGNLWGAGMSRAFVGENNPVGWLVPVGVQLIPALFLAILTPFTVESPRWLIAKGRTEEAHKALTKLRPAHDVSSGIVNAEVDAIDQSIRESKLVDQGRWVDLFGKKYWKRLFIGPVLFFFQQTNGGQFLLSYAPTFYVQMGLGTKAFTYNIVNLVCGVIGTLIYFFGVDFVGRRNFAILGTFFASFWELLATGLLNQAAKPNTAQTGVIIASFALFQIFTKIGLSCNAWVVTAETGGVQMRKKLMAYGTTIDVLAAFVVTFTYPYIANAQGANLGTKTGWIYGALSAASFVFALLLVPELKGRGLEETDELFEQKLWAWQFKNAKTSGIGATITALEGGAALPKHVEEGADLHKVESKKEAHHIEGLNH